MYSARPLGETLLVGMDGDTINVSEPENAHETAFQVKLLLPSICCCLTGSPGLFFFGKQGPPTWAIATWIRQRQPTSTASSSPEHRPTTALFAHCAAAKRIHRDTHSWSLACATWSPPYLYIFLASIPAPLAPTLWDLVRAGPTACHPEPRQLLVSIHDASRVDTTTERRDPCSRIPGLRLKCRPRGRR